MIEAEQPEEHRDETRRQGPRALEKMIEINRRLAIPEDEVAVTAVRSGGPGGQHVNKVSTQIVLTFDVEGSGSLSEAQKRRLRERLGHRLTRDGRLLVRCGRHRSQAANRREAHDRFVDLLRDALRPVRRRVPTRVPRAEKQRRLEDKRRRGRLKGERRGSGRAADD